MKPGQKKLVWIALGALALAAGWAFLRARPDPVRFTTGSVDRGDVVEVVGATGTLEAVTTVQLGSQVSGTIDSLHADFNSTVKKGQVVARLDPSLFQARRGQAEANLLAARANVDRAKASVEDMRQKYDRARELAAQKLLPQSDLETAKANYDGALAQLKANEAAQSQSQANLNQADVDLSHTIIATPIDGVVISRNVDVGQTVAASFQAPVLFLIANDLTRMRVNASVDEADVGRVREGQEVTFHVDAFPERDFLGRVEQVRLNPTAVQNVVTYNTIVAVDNQDLLLRPGMTATVSIVVRKAADALRLPASALRFRPEGFVRPGAGGGPRDAGGAGTGGGVAIASDRQGPAAAGGGAGAPGTASPDSSGRPGGQGGSRGPAAGGQRGPGAGGWRRGGDGAAPGGSQPGSAGPGGPGRGPGRPTTVFVLDEQGQPKPVEVRVGISDGQHVEVREGLEEGAVVVTGTEIPGARAGAGPRPGSSPSSNPFNPQFQRRQR
ncbi:MAG TPA: efflux RND transporter periplasmic adaptor subunit [Vicinamibacteria bacterium]|jgi:HlyD family secretion protein